MTMSQIKISDENERKIKIIMGIHSLKSKEGVINFVLDRFPLE